MGKAVLLSVALSCADQIIACPYVLQRLRLKTNNISKTATQNYSCLSQCDYWFLSKLKIRPTISYKFENILKLLQTSLNFA